VQSREDVVLVDRTALQQLEARVENSEARAVKAEQQVLQILDKLNSQQLQITQLLEQVQRLDSENTQLRAELTFYRRFAIQVGDQV
jgi:chromosome segregation ATPase